MSRVKFSGMKAAIKADKIYKQGWGETLIKNPFVEPGLTQNLATKSYLHKLASHTDDPELKRKILDAKPEMVSVDSIQTPAAQSPRAPIDCKIVYSSSYPHECMDEIAKARLTAKRFYFDADASFRIGDMMQHHMKFVVDNMPGVHVPYDPLYLVLDARAVFRGRGGILSDDADKIVSFLIVGGKVRTIAGDGNTSVLDILEFAYNTKQETIIGVDAIDLETLRMSYIYGGQRTEAYRVIAIPSAANRQIDLALSIVAAYDVKKFSDLMNVAIASGGGPLICLAALMLLNSQHEAVTRTHVPASRTMVKGGKSVALPEYHAVHIVPGKRTITTRSILATVDRRPAREHDVRGHFVHFGSQTACDHVWEPLDTFQKRYRCNKCHLRRTWRVDFKRGDASLGRIDKHYEIHRDERTTNAQARPNNQGS